MRIYLVVLKYSEMVRGVQGHIWAFMGRFTWLRRASNDSNESSTVIDESMKSVTEVWAEILAPVAPWQRFSIKIRYHGMYGVLRAVGYWLDW